MDKQDNDKNRQGLVSALKNSFLMWLLVPLLVPAVSFVIFVGARLLLGPTPEGEPEKLVFNIDFLNSFLIALVVLFLVFVATMDKLAWLCFRKRIRKGEPPDPDTRIRLLRERLAKIARRARDSDTAEAAFRTEAERIERKEAFAQAMGQCLESVETLVGAGRFRIENFALLDRCTMPTSGERVSVDFSLVGDLLAGLQDVLSQFTLCRCAMIQRLFHRPQLLDPFQDMCDLFESMSDLRGTDSHNATNDNHADAFSDRYTDELRVDRLSEKYADGLAAAAARMGAGSAQRPLRTLFVGCGWESLLSALFDKVRKRGIAVEWKFADIDPAFPGNAPGLPGAGDPERLVRLAPPFSGPYSQFAKWENQFDAVLYAHCLQHKAKSCKDDVFDALLRCTKPNGTAMLAMANSWDARFDGCAVEGLATFETYELQGDDRTLFENALARHLRDFRWKTKIRDRIEGFRAFRVDDGVWRVMEKGRNKGHVLKTCGRYLFYRHRELEKADDGCLIWSFLANDPVGDAERMSAFVRYAAYKLKRLGVEGKKDSIVRKRNAVFVSSGPRAVLVLAADVFRAGTGTTPAKRDTDRFFCLLCSRLEPACDVSSLDPRNDPAAAAAAVWSRPDKEPSRAVAVPGGDQPDDPVFVFVRPEHSLHPTAEHALFVFLPNGVWRSFLPKTCQFPLDLFERKPDEWLERCAKDFEPAGIKAALDPPTITRRMSRTTRERMFKCAGFPSIDEYYHQILADVRADWTHAGVPDGSMAGKSDVDRDARFNELPINLRLKLLDDLNVQDVLVTGVRSANATRSRTWSTSWKAFFQRFALHVHSVLSP